jgi:hypothetical protein
LLVDHKGVGIAILGGIETHAGQERHLFGHLKPGERDYKRSDSGGLFMLVTATGSKLWRLSYRFDAKQKLLALGQYPLTSLADARRDNAKTPTGRKSAGMRGLLQYGGLDVS